MSVKQFLINIPNLPTMIAFRIIRRAMRHDSSYAWSWQCNIAMAMQDETRRVLEKSCAVLNTHEIANHGAARFMQQCFGVDVRKSPEWQSLGIKPTEWPEVIG